MASDLHTSSLCFYALHGLLIFHSVSIYLLLLIPHFHAYYFIVFPRMCCYPLFYLSCFVIVSNTCYNIYLLLLMHRLLYYLCISPAFDSWILAVLFIFIFYCILLTS